MTVSSLQAELATRTSAPSGVTATLEGRLSTGTCATRVLLAVSMTDTRPPSGTTAHTSAPSGVTAMGVEDVDVRAVLCPSMARVKLMGAGLAATSKPKRGCALTPLGAIPPSVRGVGEDDAAAHGLVSRS